MIGAWSRKACIEQNGCGILGSKYMGVFRAQFLLRKYFPPSRLQLTINLAFHVVKDKLESNSACWILILYEIKFQTHSVYWLLYWKKLKEDQCYSSPWKLLPKQLVNQSAGTVLTLRCRAANYSKEVSFVWDRLGCRRLIPLALNNLCLSSLCSQRLVCDLVCNRLQ